jgi:hypothetical protein
VTAGSTRRRWRAGASSPTCERVRLVSRNGRDHTRRFRDIAAAISKLSARSIVLDGEVAIYHQQFRSRFDWLREPDPGAVTSPPLFTEERPALRPLPVEPFRYYQFGRRTVHLDNCIEVDAGYYSAPPG